MDGKTRSKKDLLHTIEVMKNKITQLETLLENCSNLEIELLEKEKLLASVFEVTEVGICITNQSGKFADVNNAYCRIYGYRKKELIGKPFTMVLPSAC